MEMYTFLPSPALKAFVQYFYTVHGDAGECGETKSFKIIADGCPGIVFQNSDKGVFSREEKVLPAAFLCGQATRHAELQLHGTFDSIYVCLHPTALHCIFGLDAQLLTDTCMELDKLAERLGNAKADTEKVQLIENYLLDKLTRKKYKEERAVQYAMDKIILSGGAIPIQHLQKEVHLSERTFERKFKQHVGLTPKLSARICSFQASLKQLSRHDFNTINDIAYQNNYADQSHLTRAFNEFAGISPYQYHKQVNNIAGNLTMLAS